MTFHIGEGITLREYLARCCEDEENGEWMVAKEINYSLDMLVFPVALDNWDIEPEEYEKIEEEVLSQGRGFGNLMNVEQLVDIIDVLRQQKSNYTEQELEASLNYYAEKDAFLELQNT